VEPGHAVDGDRAHRFFIRLEVEGVQEVEENAGFSCDSAFPVR
jgi:hypothetical protein